MAGSDIPQTLVPVFEDFSLPRILRARLLRRIILILLAAFIVVGATNNLGPKIDEASATGGGYSLTVLYPSVIRPGLAAPWQIEVIRDSGFDEEVVIATTSSYFEIYDENGLDPAPSSSTTHDSDTLLWEFDPPGGDTLMIDFDARIEPTLRGHREGTTSVMENGRRVVSVRYRTIVLP